MRAQAIAPATAAVYGVLDDALTQLGRYPEARAAAQRMLDLQPSLSSFSRASYDLEEHGDVAGATAALQRALGDAFTPADVAFCHYYLGELAFNSGQLGEAPRQYQPVARRTPSYFPLIEGIAKVEAAGGQVDAALRDYNELLSRVPLPQYISELADYEQSLGRARDAARAAQPVRHGGAALRRQRGRRRPRVGHHRRRPRRPGRRGAARAGGVGAPPQRAGRRRAGVGAAPRRPRRRGPRRTPTRRCRWDGATR